MSCQRWSSRIERRATMADNIEASGAGATHCERNNSRSAASSSHGVGRFSAPKAVVDGASAGSQAASAASSSQSSPSASR